MTTDRIFYKFLPKMYLWTRKIPLNLGSHPQLDPDLGISEFQTEFIGGGLHSPGALVRIRIIHDCYVYCIFVHGELI